METQLRTHRIRPGLMDEWVRRWREEIVPLRRAVGFTVDAAWVVRERDEFVWVVSYDGPGISAEQNAACWALPTRAAPRPWPKLHLAGTAPPC